MAPPVNPSAVNRAIMAAKMLANKISPGAGNVSMPLAGRPVPLQRKAGGQTGDAGLFDMSELHKTPDVPQSDLPRYEPPRGVSERVRDVTASKPVRDKMLDVIDQGLKMGGREWYNTEPLKKAFKARLNGHGEEAYRKYMDMVAATSPRSKVPENARNASYYYHRVMTGQGAPADEERLPSPYGHLAQGNHKLNARAVEEAGWDPLQNPKPASFVENLVGNQRPATIDTHAFRLPAILAQDPRFLVTSYGEKGAPKRNIKKEAETGALSMEDAVHPKNAAFWDAMPKKNEYGAMERYYQDLAREHGVTPAQAQAAAWIGGGPLTGLASQGTPFLGVLQDRIYKTAHETGRDPHDVLDKFIRGETPLRASGGQVKEARDGPPAGTPEETGPQAGGLSDPGGVRGGEGLLPASDEGGGPTPLEGLPRRIKIPQTGQIHEAGPADHIRRSAEDYLASRGMNYNPPKVYARVDPKRATRIAAAYDRMKHDPKHPVVRAAYDAMARETMAQYHHAKGRGFRAEFWDPDTERDPYEASPRLANEDAQKNNHLYVFPTRYGYGSKPIDPKEAEENPLLADSGERWNGKPVTVNDVFRAIHDYYGHAKEGVGFRADGEENAWRSHAAMYSPLARAAMTSETRGQNSWLNYGPHGEKNRNARTEDTVYADQKVGLMPSWTMHEGAEDFTAPKEVAAIDYLMAQHAHKRLPPPDISKALEITAKKR